MRGANSALLTSRKEAADWRFKVGFRRACQTPSASQPCFTTALLSAEGYNLLGRYTFQYSTWADLLRHFNGLLRHGSILSNSWLRRRSACVLICSRQETYGLRYCVGYRRKTYKGAGWGRAAAAYRGMLKPSDNDSTELSVGVEVFKPDQKTTSCCSVDCANKARAGKKLLRV